MSDVGVDDGRCALEGLAGSCREDLTDLDILLWGNLRTTIVLCVHD